MCIRDRYTDIHTYPGHEAKDLQYVEYAWGGIGSVSYTHLDVYKRQVLSPTACGRSPLAEGAKG